MSDVNRLVDDEPWRRFVDGKSYTSSHEERDKALAAMGYKNVEEFLEETRMDEILGDLDDEIKEQEQIEKDLFGNDLQKSVQPLEEWADENMVKDVIKADVPLFVRALMAVQHWVFATLSPEQSENLYTRMVERMTQSKWSISDLVKTIQEAEPSIDDVQAKAIARSESALIVNKSREMSFANNPPGRYGYTWEGPDDHRTTEICINIKAKIPEKGVDTIDELREIVKGEAQKYYDAKGYKTTVREWLPHPNCRHYITLIWRG